MAEIVLRVRLLSGEHLDVIYKDEGAPDEVLERVSTPAIAAPAGTTTSITSSRSL